MSRTNSSRRRRLLSVSLTMALCAGLFSFTSPAALSPATADTASRAIQAADALSRNVRQSRESTTTVVSNLYDYLLAFAMAGDTTTAAPAGRAWAMLDALEDRVSLDPDNPTKSTVSISGTALAATTSFDDVSKTVHIASVYGQNPEAFGGRDLVASLMAFNASSPRTGWFTTTVSGTSLVQTLAQSRGVLALSSAGHTTQARAAADALRSAQLSTGAFSSTATGTTANLEHTLYAVAALTAEGCPESISAANTAAAWVASTQNDDGSFTGSSDPAIVGLAANVLSAAGQTGASTKAAGYVQGLHVQNGDAADPLFDGVIAPTSAAREQIVAGTYAASRFSTTVTSTVRGIYALSAKSLPSLRLTDVGQPRPEVTGENTFTEGACVGNEGVTVVVDTGYVTPDGVDPVTVRCALGTQSTGWSTLENAGILVESVPAYLGSALCKLQGLPTQGAPYCWTTGGYWSYWHASPGELWTYSQAGASTRTPAVGTVDGWRFVPLSGAGVPPRVGPTFSAGVDVTAPVATFTSGPQGTVDGGKKLVFAFTLDDVGAKLECALDGAWGDCDAPATWDASKQTHTLLDVPNGDHTFAVRATDSWGNSKTYTRSFTVITDITPPAIAITTDPGTLTNVSSANFTMTVDDADATVECRLDDHEWGACSSRTKQDYTGLTTGEHTFAYRATDLAGNAAIATHTWTIADDAPPVVRISSGPNGYGGAPYNSTKTSATVTFAVAEAGTITSRECRLDDGAWAACTSATQAKFTGLALADGQHSVSVRVTNANGKTSDVATYRWTVDSTKPVVAIGSAPSAPTALTSAKIAFTATDDNPIYLTNCTLDTQTAKPCTSPFEVSDLSVGDHTLKISVRDVAYNYSDTLTFTWTVLETIAPQFATPTAGSITTSSATLTTDLDSGNLPQTVTATVSRGNEVVFTSAAQTREPNVAGSLSATADGLAPHTEYTAVFTATDANGVSVDSAPVTFTTAARQPTIGSAAVTTVGATAVTVTTTVDPGDVDTEVWVEYAPASAGPVLRAAANPAQRTPAQPVAAGTEPTSLTFAIDQLTPQTDYVFSIHASSAAGSVASESFTATTAAPAAPGLTFTVTPAHPLLGQEITRTWSTTGDVDTLVASGDWSGTVSPNTGSQTFTPARTGTYTYTLTASGPGGSTRVTASVVVGLPAATFTVSASPTHAHAGDRVLISGSGLDAGEEATLTVDGVHVANITASATGSVAHWIDVPSTRNTTVTVVLTGSRTDRTGSVNIAVLASAPGSFDPTPGLAATGAAVWLGGLLVGLAAIGAGSALVGRAAKRRQSKAS